MGLTLEMGTYCFLGCNAQHDHPLWTWHVFSKTVSHMQLILNVSVTSSKPIEIFFDKTQSTQALEKQETWNSPIWQYTTSRPTTKGNEINIGRRISSGLRKSWPGNRGVKWGGRVGFGVSESYIEEPKARGCGPWKVLQNVHIPTTKHIALSLFSYEGSV